ncbi:hypothetical protein JHN45_43955 [Streptomyces sp. MBT53]|nr:hypothetical protein [Streptomyces sp. MBT53]
MQAAWLRKPPYLSSGPAVDGLAAFAQNGAECHDEFFDDRDRFTHHTRRGGAVVQVVRGSAGFGRQDMRTLFRVVIETAEEGIGLATACIAPDAFFVELLCAGAWRWRPCCRARTPANGCADWRAGATERASRRAR